MTSSKLYAVIAEEIESGKLEKGAWLKALERASGDKTIAQGRYIQIRIRDIKSGLPVHPMHKSAARLAKLSALVVLVPFVSAWFAGRSIWTWLNGLADIENEATSARGHSWVVPVLSFVLLSAGILYSIAISYGVIGGMITTGRPFDF